MCSDEDIRMAQLLVRAGAAARFVLAGDSEQAKADQEAADAICERLEALIDKPEQPPAS